MSPKPAVGTVQHHISENLSYAENMKNRMDAHLYKVQAGSDTAIILQAGSAVLLPDKLAGIKILYVYGFCVLLFT